MKKSNSNTNMNRDSRPHECPHKGGTGSGRQKVFLRKDQVFGVQKALGEELSNGRVMESLNNFCRPKSKNQSLFVR